MVKVGQLDEARALGDGVCSVLETGVIVVPDAAVVSVDVGFEDADDDDDNAQTLP